MLENLHLVTERLTTGTYLQHTAYIVILLTHSKHIFQPHCNQKQT